MDEDQRTKRFVKIRDQVAHMTAMLNDVLTVGKLEAGTIEFKPELFDLDALFTEIVSDFRRAEPTCQIVYSCAGECAEIRADPKLMRQIINNLLSNALKYSPESSAVNLTLTCNESEVVLQFKDEGIGIPEEDQARLFEPFHRAGNVSNTKGTGLGLSIVKQCVELHGGSIDVESEVGKGSTFRVLLPTA